MKTKVLIGLALAGGACAARRKLASFAKAKASQCVAMCSGGGCHGAPQTSAQQQG